MGAGSLTELLRMANSLGVPVPKWQPVVLKLQKLPSLALGCFCIMPVLDHEMEREKYPMSAPFGVSQGLRAEVSAVFLNRLMVRDRQPISPTPKPGRMSVDISKVTVLMILPP